MNLLLHSRRLPWLVLPAGLLALGLWWRMDHTADTYTAGEIAPLTHREKPVRPSAARIPEHSAYQALVARKEQAAIETLGVSERGRQIRQQRGDTLATAERELALEILAGKVSVEGVSGGAFHWLADDILTSLRLQEPPQPNLAKDLADIAAAPATDPVVRDYIIQHLGHLWEQRGFDKRIADALWAAVDSTDEITPGSALIALRGGYIRDLDTQHLARVRAKAWDLAASPATPLPTRVTALGIAGDGGSPNAKELANRLLATEDTPVILKRVAEAINRN